MGISKLAFGVVLALAIGSAVAPRLHAQHTGQQQHQQTMQKDMGQVQNMMQRMDLISERAHHLSQEMSAMHSGQSQMVESHRALERMEESMAAMAKRMKGFMVDALMMMQDGALMGDSEMRADMEYLSEHLEAAAKWMENALDVMERMHERAVQQSSGR